MRVRTHLTLCLDRPNGVPLPSLSRSSRSCGGTHRGMHRRILNCPPLTRLYKMFWFIFAHDIHESIAVSEPIHRNNVFQFWFGSVSTRIHTRDTQYTQRLGRSHPPSWGGGAMKHRIPRPTPFETKTRMFQSPSWPVTQYTPYRGDVYCEIQFT